MPYMFSLCFFDIEIGMRALAGFLCGVFIAAALKNLFSPFSYGRHFFFSGAGVHG
jgi:hypothetical protein